jgi:putative SOS response-associated peptidase YedK
MCGRYYNRAEKQRIAEAMHTKVPRYNIAPSYNIAPQTFQPVVRLNHETGERELTLMRWGLIPYWSKDEKIGYSTINARAESVTTNASFREAIKRRRCLVPAEGFYEWEKLDKKSKQAYAFTVKDQAVIAFAGLWETWKDKATGEPLETYSIITTDPNELIKPEDGPTIHDRMPVILAPKDYERWLAPAEPSHLPIDLLRPYPAEEMKAWKVPNAVGNVNNNTPDLCEPIREEVCEPASQAGLFG